MAKPNAANPETQCRTIRIIRGELAASPKAKVLQMPGIGKARGFRIRRGLRGLRGNQVAATIPIPLRGSLPAH